MEGGYVPFQEGNESMNKLFQVNFPPSQFRLPVTSDTRAYLRCRVVRRNYVCKNNLVLDFEDPKIAEMKSGSPTNKHQQLESATGQTYKVASRIKHSYPGLASRQLAIHGAKHPVMHSIIEVEPAMKTHRLRLIVYCPWQDLSDFHWKSAFQPSRV